MIFFQILIGWGLIVLLYKGEICFFYFFFYRAMDLGITVSRAEKMKMYLLLTQRIDDRPPTSLLGACKPPVASFLGVNLCQG